MTSRDFCYWLQGYFEIRNEPKPNTLTPEQVEIIKNHLAMVFFHEIDPSHGDKKHQEELTKIHGGKSIPGLTPEEVKKIVQATSPDIQKLIDSLAKNIDMMPKMKC